MKLLPRFLLLALICVGCTFRTQGDTLYVDWIRSTPRVEPQVDPVKPPNPGKFTSGNLIVLVMEDFKGKQVLSNEQLLAINGKSVRDTLKENCLKDASKQPMYRLRIDKDATLTGVWKELATPLPTKFPALLMKNGDNVYREALPEKQTDIEKIVNEYAGVSK